MPKTIDDLLAESEIRDIHLRFCRANDRRDEALTRSCFHPDAVIDLHEPLDVDGLIAFRDALFDQYSVTWHNTGNQLVEVEGDAAWAEHYTVSSHRIPADGERPARDLVASGRYVDRMERRDGTWRIARRTMILDFVREDPVPPGEAAFAPTAGARDRSDPSYAMRLSPDPVN